MTICETLNLPLNKMDKLILERLVNKVLTLERVTVILKEWLTHQSKKQEKTDQRLKQLEKALRVNDDGLKNRYSAIEKGVITLDSSL